ncbi:MAG: prepilin-type N-terminal cleavage/methylation domain-containing protein [Deltaproteobacteria bacterium]|nr:MAG: prepilin-type N-terminal cleavage/methylation domain-containing protein [Deltaproteobacteria bacterium]
MLDTKVQSRWVGARGFTLVELMIVFAIIGILGAIAVPNFLKFQARARQSEAKANLRGYFTSAKSFYAEQGTYACGDSCGFRAAKNNRYAYDFGYGTAEPKGIPTDPSQAAAACDYQGSSVASQSATGFVARASGNVDHDSNCDSWSINHKGVLLNEFNDVDN